MAQERKRQMYSREAYPGTGSNSRKRNNVVDLNRAARLREARQAAGFATAAEAIAAFGWKQSTYWGHENGTRGIPHHRILIYAASFRVAADWLAFGQAPSGGPSPRRIIIEGYMASFGRIVSKQELSAADTVIAAIDDTEAPSTIAGEFTAYRVSGNGNYPAYRDGDILFTPRGKNQSPDNYLNKECLVTMLTGERLVRTILRGSRAGLFVLMGFNYPPLIDVEIAAVAPIEWIKRG